MCRAVILSCIFLRCTTALCAIRVATASSSKTWRRRKRAEYKLESARFIAVIRPTEFGTDPSKHKRSVFVRRLPSAMQSNAQAPAPYMYLTSYIRRVVLCTKYFVLVLHRPLHRWRVKWRSSGLFPLFSLLCPFRAYRGFWDREMSPPGQRFRMANRFYSSFFSFFNFSSFLLPCTKYYRDRDRRMRDMGHENKDRKRLVLWVRILWSTGSFET